MFRTIIKSVIETLDKILSELKRAYDETYGLSDLNREFRNKVNEIKKRNKKNFIKAAENFETIQGIATLEFPTIDEIKKRAKEKWLEAVARGDIDELNSIKERSNNE